MQFITNIYYTENGIQKIIPFITNVDQNLKNYEQYIEAETLGEMLLKLYAPKESKSIRDIHFRNYEVGEVSLNLN